MSDILVYAQLDDGRLHDVALQCLAAARTLAGASGAKVRALVAGPGAAAAAAAAIAAGADEVLTADDPALSPVLAAPHVALLKQTVQATGPGMVLLPSTTTGNDLAPLLAAALDAACILDADAVALKDGRPVFQRLEFDRKALSSYSAKGTVVATLRDGVAPNPASDASRTGTVTPVASPAAASRSKVVRRDVTGHTVNLRGARIVVGAGAGVGSAANFEKIRELAAALGAELGATRAVVDAGWLPAGHQIGQTGVIIRPDVYIAVGISGAVQHWVGVSEARRIVAVNTDKNCPMMKRAHFRIEGDLNTIVPKLTKIAREA